MLLKCFTLFAVINIKLPDNSCSFICFFSPMKDQQLFTRFVRVGHQFESLTNVQFSGLMLIKLFTDSELRLFT